MISILTTVTAVSVIFITSEVAGSQTDGALVIDARRDFRNQIMMFPALQRLEQKIKLVKYAIFIMLYFSALCFQ